MSVDEWKVRRQISDSLHITKLLLISSWVLLPLFRRDTKCGQQNRNAGSSEINRQSTRTSSSKASQQLQSKRHRQKSSLWCGVINNRYDRVFTIITLLSSSIYMQLYAAVTCTRSPLHMKTQIAGHDSSCNFAPWTVV